MPRVGAICPHRVLLPKLRVVVHNFAHQLFDYLLSDPSARVRRGASIFSSRACSRFVKPVFLYSMPVVRILQLGDVVALHCLID